MERLACFAYPKFNYVSNLGIIWKKVIGNSATIPRRSLSCLYNASFNRTTSRHRKCLQQHSTFVTSSCLFGGKYKNTKRKLLKPIEYKQQKSQRLLKEVVSIRNSMTVQELADVIGKDVDHVFEAMLFINNTDRYDRPNSVIDDVKVIKDIVDKTGLRWKFDSKPAKDEKTIGKDISKRPPPDASVLKKRPPVVTIMGHVDHGKTTLLDQLRSSNIVAQEFGGITQHIGAFSVNLSNGQAITFLDTPGHAAFSAMRARGAMVTDIVVLVVAADDGVMKQTLESVRYAQEAQVPIIVAINKIDKPDANIEQTKKSLLQHGIILEDFGGEIQAVPISALKGTNLDMLQESILALGEILDIKADPTGLAEATVIESSADVSRGKLSTALVQRGTLRKGSILVAGTAWAKIRGMFDDRGKPVLEASPGSAVEIIGWRDLPSAGEEILEVNTEQEAKEVVSFRQHNIEIEKKNQDSSAIGKKIEEHQREYQEMRKKKLESGIRRGGMYRRIRTTETIQTYVGPQLAIIVKGDVDGSVEAILDVIDSYKSDQCRLHLLSYGIGPITEGDIEMAKAFKGIIYGFNVPSLDRIESQAKSSGVVVKRYNVIYKLIDDLKQRLTEQLPELQVDEVVGEANVLADFTVTEGKRKINVAGCRCVKGSLQKKKCFKLIRNGETLIENSQLQSLKHFKNEVDLIKTDVECGLSFSDQQISLQPGDVVVCFERVGKKQEIKWNLDFL